MCGDRGRPRHRRRALSDGAHFIPGDTLLSLQIPRPAPDEHAPFYAGYVAAVADRDVPGVLRRQAPALRAACAGLSEEEALARYAPGKWSVKEVLGHMADAERIFAYRLLRVARGDETPLSGFDEQAYVAAAGFDRQPTEALLEQFEQARAATLGLLRGLGPEAWERRGTANGHPVTARALGYILAGHAEHHLAILRERYGLAVPLPDDAA